MHVVYACVHMYSTYPSMPHQNVLKHFSSGASALLFNPRIAFLRKLGLRASNMSTMPPIADLAAQPPINPTVPDSIPPSGRPPRTTRRFAPLNPDVPNHTNAPRLKGVVFDVDGTLWYLGPPTTHLPTTGRGYQILWSHSPKGGGEIDS